jgi:hypothetical protein
VRNHDFRHHSTDGLTGAATPSLVEGHLKDLAMCRIARCQLIAFPAFPPRRRATRRHRSD